MRGSLAERYRQKLNSDLGRVGDAPTRSPVLRDDTTPRAGINPVERSRGVSGGRQNQPAAVPRSDVAGHRYARPGRGPSDVVATPGTRDTRGLNSPSSGRPRLSGTRTVRTATDIASPRLRPRTIVDHAWRSSSPSRYFSGSTNWGSHHASLWCSFGYTPRWCRWGLYSYPFYWSCWWPRWYWSSRSAFVFSWNSHSPWLNWSVSVPLADPYWSDDWYYVSAHDPVVIREVYYEPAEEETIRVGEEVPVEDPAAGAGSAEPDSRTLAEKHVGLGDFYFQDGRYREASESYLRALTYEPEDATLHFVAADCMFALGDYHYAAFLIGRALRLDPGIATAEADKRTFYKDPAVFERQLATLRSYLADKPYDAAAHLVHGYNLKFSEQPKAALAAFERVLEIAPEDESAMLFKNALTSAPAAATPEERK